MSADKLTQAIRNILGCEDYFQVQAIAQAALVAHQAQQAEPAGYVTAIEEGKVLMLPRASLDPSKLVPVYAAPQQAQAPSEIQRRFDNLLAAEHALSNSYVRIREIIGAMSPPVLEPAALYAYVEDCARKFVQQAQAPGWQPIATAPENTEREVVVQWMDSDGAICRDLDYREDGCWMGWHNHAEHVQVIGGHGVSYTPPYKEWMPLPAPQQGSVSAAAAKSAGELPPTDHSPSGSAHPGVCALDDAAPHGGMARDRLPERVPPAGLERSSELPAQGHQSVGCDGAGSHGVRGGLAAERSADGGLAE